MKVVLTSEFCYGHRLQNYNGKCSRLHGHNAKLEVTLESVTAEGYDAFDENGFVIDFTVAKNIIKGVTDDFDHYCILENTDPLVKALSDLKEDFKIVNYPPTAEYIVRTLMDRIDSALRNEPVSGLIDVVRVVLWETANNCAVVEA